MVDVLTSIEINRPKTVVAAYACNPDKAPKWYVNIKSARRLQPEQQLSTGSKIAFTAEFMGRKLTYTYEIITNTPDLFVMRTAEGPFPMETSYIFETLSENVTRMSLRNRGNPSGFSKLMAPFMSMMMRRANMKDLKNLKNILEQH